MKPDLLFSIVIPTYNRAGYIPATIRSILAQTYPEFELIVVDDGSTDNTEQIVRSFNDPRIYYFKKQNAERGAARNYGTERAHGDYVTFLDSDDLAYPNMFESAREAINRLSTPPFFHMRFEIKNGENKVIGKKSKIKNETSLSIRKGNYISCTGVFLRKDIADHFRFNEDIRLSVSEDWELWLRIIANVGVKSDPAFVASLTQHDHRSVLNISEEKLLLRKTLSFEYAFKDAKVSLLYSPYKQMMEAYFDLYIALHLALAKQSKRSLHYLRNALGSYPKVLFEKRFFAVIKHLILNFFNF